MAPVHSEALIRSEFDGTKLSRQTRLPGLVRLNLKALGRTDVRSARLPESRWLGQRLEHRKTLYVRHVLQGLRRQERQAFSSLLMVTQDSSMSVGAVATSDQALKLSSPDTHRMTHNSCQRALNWRAMKLKQNPSSCRAEALQLAGKCCARLTSTAAQPATISRSKNSGLALNWNRQWKSLQHSFDMTSRLP